MNRFTHQSITQSMIRVFPARARLDRREHRLVQEGASSLPRICRRSLKSSLGLATAGQAAYGADALQGSYPVS